MDINVRTIDQVTIIDLNGEIDGKTAPQAQEKIVPVAQTAKTLLLDLSQVPYMSSAGLRLMLLLYRQMTSSNGRIALVGVADEIRDTMSATGFLNYFSTYDSIDAALGALNQVAGQTQP